ncbi:MAG: hypothetical protein QMD09_13030 [Desulfatibacillaceae bacterium]|nr:hypothetical protein [Desulfatibacillaceae bacterium]
MARDERRSMERFCMVIPAMITRLGAGKNNRPLVLSSRDICSGGGYFPCEKPFPVDTRVEVGMLIPGPGFAKNGRKGAHVKVSGVVVRQELGGMAIRFDRRYRMAPFPD